MSRSTKREWNKVNGRIHHSYITPIFEVCVWLDSSGDYLASLKDLHLCENLFRQRTLRAKTLVAAKTEALDEARRELGERLAKHQAAVDALTPTSTSARRPATVRGVVGRTCPVCGKKCRAFQDGLRCKSRAGTGS